MVLGSLYQQALNMALYGSSYEGKKHPGRVLDYTLFSTCGMTEIATICPTRGSSGI